MIKKLFKKPLLHHGLVFYAGKISQMCIRSSSGFHGLIFQKESKQTNDRGIFHSSPAQEKKLKIQQTQAHPGALWSYTYPSIYTTLGAHSVTKIPKQNKIVTRQNLTC